MVETIFIDSSAFVGFNNSSDTLHKKSVKILQTLIETKVHLITSTNIIMETATVLSQKADHQTAREFLRFIRDGDIQVIHPDEETMAHAEELFIQQTSKNVSYSDCICFAIMQEKGIRKAFTFDDDFRKNGFIPLQG